MLTDYMCLCSGFLIPTTQIKKVISLFRFLSLICIRNADELNDTLLMMMMRMVVVVVAMMMMRMRMGMRLRRM